jgi:hypothetical protein
MSERAASVEAGRGLGTRMSWLLLPGVLLVLTVVIVHRIDRGEFNLHTDEAQHAVTGLYFYDLLGDLPLAHPIEYTYRYYAQYPALGLIHWPPLFHFVEGVMFRILSPSVITARVTVLLFALIGCVFWFLLVQELQNRWTAALSTLLLGLNPELILYEQSVMLEVPSLSLAVAASYFWLRYLRQGGRRHLHWFVVLACLALLTKQTVVYLAAFCLMTVLSHRKLRLLAEREVLRGIIVCLLVLAPFFVAAFLLHGQTISYDVLKRAGSSNPFLYYLTKLPEQLGIPVFVLSLIGLFTQRWWDEPRNSRDMMMWILACYLTFTALAGKETRYILYWLPPFTYFAAGPLTTAVRVRWLRLTGATVGLLLVGAMAARAWTYERPYVAGYAKLAQHLIAQQAGGIILFDGDLPGNFIFYLRKYDPSRRFVVMRKALYVSRIDKSFGSEELVRTDEQIFELLRDYGIRHIVVTQGSPLQFEIQQRLRDLLRGPEFRRVMEVPVESNLDDWRGRGLVVYEYLHAGPRTAKVLRLRMLTLLNDIEVPLDELGIP